MRSASLLILFVALLLITGCGDSGVTRYAVHGVVTVEGVSGKNGTLSFVPSSPDAKFAIITVKDGAYAFDARKGPSAGTFNVFFQVEAPAPVTQTATKGGGSGRAAGAEAAKEKQGVVVQPDALEINVDFE